MTPNWQTTTSNDSSSNGRLLGVGLAPDDTLDAGLRRREIEHRLVQIGRDDFSASREHLAPLPA